MPRQTFLEFSDGPGLPSTAATASTDADGTTTCMVTRTCKRRALFAVVCVAAAAAAAALAVALRAPPETPAPNILVPEWKTGATLDYSLFTAAAGGRSELVRAVNTGRDTGHYVLASDTMEDAVSHAVENNFPFFGRVSVDNLSVYENGIPQRIFGSFPITSPVVAGEWTFSLLGRKWQARATRVTTASVTFRATSPSATLDYSLDVRAGFIGHMRLTDTAGVRLLDISLNNADDGYSGDAFFVRATDLFDQTFNSTRAATLSVGAHRSDGDWDMLVYSLDVNVDCDASQGSMASVTLEEAHGGASRLDKSFARCVEEQATTGTVTKPLSDEYRVAVVAAGRRTALRLRIAGGLLHKYTVVV